MTHRHAALAVLVVALSAAGVDVRAGVVLARERPVPEAGATGIVEIEVDPAAYHQLWSEGHGIVESFPLPGGQRVALELSSFPVLAPGAVLVNVGPDGEHRTPAPSVHFLRGVVIGDVDSLVVLDLFQERIAGFIHTSTGEYGVGPEQASLSSPEGTKLRVWSREQEAGGWTCDASAEVEPEPELLEPSLPLAPRGGVQLALRLAMESTTEWCAHFGNNASTAQLYLLNLAAAISAIYDAEINELVQVSFLRTFCGTADPYTDGLTQLANRQQLLSELKAYWSANMGGVSRAAAHLYTYSSAGSTGGLAQTYVCSPQCQAVLCNNSWGYGVSMLPVLGGSPPTYEIQVAAHELGHNHSSPHSNCLRTAGGQWLSTCAVENCNGNPWCQAAGCYPGPVANMTGTLMSTLCNPRVSMFEDTVEGPILRGAAEAASCIVAAGMPGEVTQATGGLLLSKPASCANVLLQHDDGGLNTSFGAAPPCGNCRYAWIKRFAPACHPLRLTRIDAMVTGVSVGRPLRLLIYTDPTGSGLPSNATLVYTQDVSVTVVGPPAFNSYVLMSPVVVGAGDLYVGLYDVQASSPGPSVAAMDTSVHGDSYNAFNSTDPGAFSPRPEGTWLIRALGGPVPAGSVVLDWSPPCNDATVPGQDYAVYRGAVGSFTSYNSLTCSTGSDTTFLAEAPPNGSFFLVVPHTTVSEGSYGRTSAGVERPPAAAACKPQDFETCAAAY